MEVKRVTFIEELTTSLEDAEKAVKELKEREALKTQELNELKEKVKYFNEKEKQYEGIVIEIPLELRTPIQQYLTFFQDYVRIAKSDNVEFHINKTDNGLKINTKITEEVEKEKMQNWLDEYMDFIKTNMDNITINTEGNPNPHDIDLLVLDLKNEVTHLKNSLEIANFKNQFLDKELVFLKQLTLTFAEKDTVIHNQYIQDGSQQFADKIDNKKP